MDDLRLTVPTAADADDWARLFADPAVAAWLWPGGLGGPRTPRQARAILDGDADHWARRGYGPWAVRLPDGTFAGRAGLEDAVSLGRGDVEVLWSLVPGAHGRGVATAAGRAALRLAFEELGLASVIAYTLPENTASQAVMRRLGMTEEAAIVHAGLPHVLFRISRDTDRPPHGR